MGSVHRVAWEGRCQPDSDAPQDRNKQVGSIPLHPAGAEVASDLFRAWKDFLDTASVERLADLDDMVSVYHFRHPLICFLPRHEQMEAEVVVWEVQMAVDTSHPDHTTGNVVVKAERRHNAAASFRVIQSQGQNQNHYLERPGFDFCRRHPVSLSRSSCMSLKPAGTVLT